MTSSRRLSQNIVNRVFAGSLGTLDEGLPKANFFNLIWFDAVLTDVLNAILRLYELTDGHSAILGEHIGARN